MRFITHLKEMYISQEKRKLRRRSGTGDVTSASGLRLASSNAEMLEMIKRDCGPFLKSKFIFFRGVEGMSDEMFAKRSSRRDRAPRDMPPEIHEVLNQAFKKKFGWAARSEGTFATQVVGDTYDYGLPHMFFPIGNFKYVWSPNYDDIYGFLDKIVAKAGEDLAKKKPEYKENEFTWYGSVSSLALSHSITGDNIGNWVYLHTTLGIKSKVPSTIDGIKKAIGTFIVSSYTDKNLEDSGKSEVAFRCDNYYLLDDSFRTIIEKELGLNRFRG
jgi:hypothetical protein